ncbi:PREDICTED: uncharacterized protein LOC105854492 [Condylura cristata]|uniref:uncharacterized protein LOC105854492 n=1 Tax=Condylura cristata TaxID=143302 RepID=UPI000643D74D|nr:PREDICTED: uncharacterized protein LOC105854492 [Condylura cristata]
MKGPREGWTSQARPPVLPLPLPAAPVLCGSLPSQALQGRTPWKGQGLGQETPPGRSGFCHGDSRGHSDPSSDISPAVPQVSNAEGSGRKNQTPCPLATRAAGRDGPAPVQEQPWGACLLGALPGGACTQPAATAPTLPLGGVIPKTLREVPPVWVVPWLTQWAWGGPALGSQCSWAGCCGLASPRCPAGASCGLASDRPLREALQRRRLYRPQHEFSRCENAGRHPGRHRATPSAGRCCPHVVMAAALSGHLGVCQPELVPKGPLEPREASWGAGEAPPPRQDPERPRGLSGCTVLPGRSRPMGSGHMSLRWALGAVSGTAACQGNLWPG